MSLTQAQIEQFEADGYLFLPSLFTPEEARILCAEALESERRDNAFAISDKVGSAALSLWIETRDDPLGALVRHPRLVVPSRQLLHDEIYHWHSKVIFKKARSAGSWAWHQDYGYWYFDGAPEARMLSCMVFLDEAREDNGCLQMLAGSHKLGRLEHEHMAEYVGGQMGVKEETIQQVAGDLPVRKMTGAPGGVVIWHSNTFHRSEANSTDYPRTSFIACYNALSNAPEPGKGHGKPVPITLSEEDSILHCAERAAVQASGNTP